MVRHLHNIAYRIVIITLFLLPFHAFGTVFLNYKLGLNQLFGANIINLWKEAVLILLTLLLGLKLFFTAKTKDHPALKKLLALDLLDVLILAYILFGIVHFAFIKSFHPFAQLFLGAKYDYLFLYALLIVKDFYFSDDEIKGLVKSVLVGGSLAILSSYVLHFIVKPENFTLFGFRQDWSTWKPQDALAYCQKIENQELCRMSGTFAGPNQFGAYIVVFLAPLLLWWQKGKAILTSRYLAIVIGILALVALFLTYSRAAYIGAFLTVITFLYLRYGLQNDLFKKIIKITIPVIILLPLLALLAFDRGNLFIRPGSTQKHWESWQLGITEIAKHPFGQGLGSSGPASFNFEHPIIPENWYLQVGVELGIIGLLLFLAILFLIAKNLHQQRQFTFLASFIGIMAMAMFLHTFEDAPTSLTLFILLGATVSQTLVHRSGD